MAPGLPGRAGAAPSSSLSVPSTAYLYICYVYIYVIYVTYVIYVHTRTHTHTHMYVCIDIHIYVTYMSHIMLYTHTHTHTHTHTPKSSQKHFFGGTMHTCTLQQHLPHFCVRICTSVVVKQVNGVPVDERDGGGLATAGNELGVSVGEEAA